MVSLNMPLSSNSYELPGSERLDTFFRMFVTHRVLGVVAFPSNFVVGVGANFPLLRLFLAVLAKILCPKYCDFAAASSLLVDLARGACVGHCFLTSSKPYSI